MHSYVDILKISPLFSGIAEHEIPTLLGCLSVQERTYARNEFVLRFGERVDSVALVLTGGVHIIQEDFWGNRHLMAQVRPGQAFAESYACTQGATLFISAVAVEPTSVLFLNVRKIMTTCSINCEFHARLIRNLLASLAEKNLQMNEKLLHIAQRTTREKLLSYLSAESQRQNRGSFSIPFNRQQLADYLCVDRSAMSNELSKLRDEGLLTFDRNHFSLL